MTTADDRALLQVWVRGESLVMRSESHAFQTGDILHATPTVEESGSADTPATAGVEPSVADLIGELVSAGLVSVAVCDGDVSYALTPQGQLAARQMSMSQNAHARVLLGALMVASDTLN